MRKNTALLSGILVLGFILRLTASWYGLPHLYHADEPIVVNHALAYGTGDFNPHFFKIPPLISYLLFGVYGLFYFLGHLAGKFESLRAFEFLFYSDPSFFYMAARLLFGVLAGTFTLFVFYRLIERHFSQKTALIGAAFLTVNFLHVRDSHYIYADIPLVLVMTSAFFAFFKLLEAPTARRHLWCGAMIGLATAVKYNGAALVIPYVFLSWRSRSSKLMVYAGLSAAIIFVFLNPFAFLDFHFFREELRQQALSNSGVPWHHHFHYSLAGAAGIPLLILGFLGIQPLTFGRDAKKEAFLLFGGAYYLILVFAGQPYDRYVLPMIPFVIFFAADFISQMMEKRRAVLSVSCWICFVVALTPGLVKSILLDHLLLAPDTRTLAREWFVKNIPSETPIALDWDFYMPRLSFTQKQLQDKKMELQKNPAEFSAARKRKLDFLLSQPARADYELYFMNQDSHKEAFLFARPLIAYNLAELRSRGIQYVLIAQLGKGAAGPHDFYEQLEREAQKVAVFSPYRDQKREYPYDEQPLTAAPFLFKELWNRERNGQTIEIYKLP